MSEENKAPAALTAGSIAPDFTLQARSGKTISLHDFAGRKDVLIYFYPKDDTPGCTRESCSLRDGWADLGKAGIEVLGISRDDAASHNAFAAKYNLPFELLTDADHAVHENYGAWGQNPNPAWGIGPLRKSFLVGKDGRVKHVFDKVDTERHADQVLRAAGFMPAPKPAPAPAAATVAGVAEAARTAVATAVSKVAEKVEKAAVAVEKAAVETAAPAAPRIAAAKKAVKAAVKKVVRKAKKAVAKAKVKKVVRKAKKAVAKAKVKKAVRKVKKAAPKKKAAKRTARRTARKAVRKVKRAVRKAKRAAPKSKAKKNAKRKKR
ncbi:MAG TPA: peroxiredoxin [Thermoanaerobaculia bacterium]|jgi:peroxiredoxin Q/BCP